jgi:DNA-binding MarR family transcriptional regulator
MSVPDCSSYFWAGPKTGAGDASAERCAWELLDAVPPLMWHIRRSMRSFRRGLSMPQFRAMVLIANEPEACLSAVAEHLALSLPTTSRMVSGLVGKGLLTRQDCATDRRQVSLGVTARGRSVLDAAWSGTGRELAGHLAGVPPDRRAAVVAAMGVVRDLFGSLGLPQLDAAAKPKRRRRTPSG